MYLADKPGSCDMCCMAGGIEWWESRGKLISFRKIPKPRTNTSLSFLYVPDQDTELLFGFDKLFFLTGAQKVKWDESGL